MSPLFGFITTGNLGPLRFGMTVEEIVAVLGTAEGEAVQRKGRMLKYGSLQLWLQGAHRNVEKLTAVFVYFGTREELPPAVRFAEAVPDTRAAVSAWLAAAEIVPVKETTEPVEEIRLPSGVTFGFDEIALHLVSCWA